jgi:diamine N-acetyltransferase
MSSSASITKSSTVTLRVIDKENWRAITQLEVLEEQQGNVSSNAMSLCESHYSEDAWVRAIYADETPVGFLMMSIWDPEKWYYIWRFMIDHRYQRLGFGSAAVKLAIRHVRESHPQAEMIGLMATSPNGKKNVVGKKDVPPEHSPYNFYASLGWKDIKDVDENGQIEMGLYL